MAKNLKFLIQQQLSGAFLIVNVGNGSIAFLYNSDLRDQSWQRGTLIGGVHDVLVT